MLTNKMLRTLSYIIALLFIPAACVDSFPEPVQEDEGRTEVFSFNTDKVTYGTDWVSCDVHEFYFDPEARVDSIVFEAGLRSQFDEEKCIARLYNYDEDKTVIGSTVESFASYVIHTVRSGDIQRTFPRGEVRLGAQFRSTREGQQ